MISWLNLGKIRWYKYCISILLSILYTLIYILSILNLLKNIQNRKISKNQVKKYRKHIQNCIFYKSDQYHLGTIHLQLVDILLNLNKFCKILDIFYNFYHQGNIHLCKKCIKYLMNYFILCILNKGLDIIHIDY